MARQERIINFDDPKARAKVANGIQRMRGRWRLTFVRYRPRRSDRQNAYYWPCFVQPFADWLRDHGHHANEQMAHEMLKAKFLKRDVIDHETGEVIGEVVQSTTALDTSEFNIYLDQCAQFLAEFCDIVVPEPSEYREPHPTSPESYSPASANAGANLNGCVATRPAALGI